MLLSFWWSRLIFPFKTTINNYHKRYKCRQCPLLLRKTDELWWYQEQISTCVLCTMADICQELPETQETN